MKTAILVGSLLVCGCGNFIKVTPRQGGAMADPGRTPGATGGTIKPGVTDMANTRRADATTRTVCRTAATPSGFVAIDYVSAAGCAAGPDSTALNAKVVTDLKAYWSGASLRICKDQPIPDGWYSSGYAEKSEQCAKQRGIEGANTVDITKR